MCYIGYFPVFPGTVGSIAAFIIYLLIPKSVIESPVFFVFPIILFLASVFITGKAEEEMEKDDKRIVLDEMAGYFIAIMFLPKSFLVGFIALILFRIFDISKPSPIYELQKLPRGWGVVIDDVMAGIYANLCLQIIFFLFIVNL